MKKNFILLILSMLFFFTSSATIHIIQVANFQFSPANVPDVYVGDTVRWTWVSGSHTTTDNPATDDGTTLPPGASSWNSNINSTTKTFDYKVTVAGVYNYWCRPHAPDMAASFTASIAMPVKFAGMAVSGANGKVIINWKTSTEQNTAFFSVRRSQNGTTYNELAKIPAAGFSATDKTYSFTDVNIESDKYYYYNIMTVDKDGKQEFSEVKMFKGDGVTSKIMLSVSPNPISRPGHLMLTFNAAKEGEMQVTVVNSQGQVVIKNQMQAYIGVNNGHVHLGNLAPGNYTLSCTLNGVAESRQIIFK
jgi:plastocyanin